jgi:hypothetical protein
MHVLSLALGKISTCSCPPKDLRASLNIDIMAIANTGQICYTPWAL